MSLLFYDKRTLFESDTMKPKKLNAELQYKLDLELVKKKPANRTEAKAHLAAQLRISKLILTRHFRTAFVS